MPLSTRKFTPKIYKKVIDGFKEYYVGEVNNQGVPNGFGFRLY